MKKYAVILFFLLVLIHFSSATTYTLINQSFTPRSVIIPNTGGYVEVSIFSSNVTLYENWSFADASLIDIENGHYALFKDDYNSANPNFFTITGNPRNINNMLASFSLPTPLSIFRNFQNFQTGTYSSVFMPIFCNNNNWIGKTYTALYNKDNIYGQWQPVNGDISVITGLACNPGTTHIGLDLFDSSAHSNYNLFSTLSGGLVAEYHYNRNNNTFTFLRSYPSYTFGNVLLVSRKPVWKNVGLTSANHIIVGNDTLNFDYTYTPNAWNDGAYNSRTGIYDSGEDRLFIITYDNKLLYFQNMKVNKTAIDMSTVGDCNNILNTPTLNLMDIQCKNTLDDCYAVGFTNGTTNDGVIFRFNPTSCTTMTPSIDMTNRSLWSISYDPTYDKLWLGGKQTLMTVSDITDSVTNPNTAGMCINSKYFCNAGHVIQTGSGFSCDSTPNSIQFCNLGCNQITNECKQRTDCIDSCIFQGEVINLVNFTACTSGTSYGTCGFYDGTGCLSIQNTQCGINEVCSTSNQIGATPCISALTNQNTTLFNVFDIRPQLQNTIDTTISGNSYNVNQVNRQISINFQGVGVEVPFSATSSNTSGYISSICDYKEYLLYNATMESDPYLLGLMTGQAYNRVTAKGKQWLFINSSIPVNTTALDINTSQVSFTINPDSFDVNNLSTIAIREYTDTNIMKELFVRFNYSDTSVCAYYGNTTQDDAYKIFCNINLFYTPDNAQTTYTIINDLTNNLISVKSDIIDVNGAHLIQYSASKPFDTNGNLKKITFSAGINQTMLLNKVNIIGNTAYNNLKPFSVTNQFLVDCNYYNSGVYDVRAYYMPSNNPSFYNYVDWQVFVTLTNNGSISNAVNPNCVTLPNGQIVCPTSGDLITRAQNSSLSKGMRLFWAIVIIIGLFIIIMFATYLSTKSTILTTALCTFEFISGVSLFTIMKWIDPAIIIMTLVICAGITYLFLRFIVTGQSSRE